MFKLTADINLIETYTCNLNNRMNVPSGQIFLFLVLYQIGRVAVYMV